MEKKKSLKPKSDPSYKPTSAEDKVKKAGKKALPNYLRYTGLAFEMAATIGLGIWFGYLLDHWLALQYPIFLMSFSFLSLFGSIYILYKALNE